MSSFLTFTLLLSVTYCGPALLTDSVICLLSLENNYLDDEVKQVLTEAATARGVTLEL